ncbi:MAG: UPF0182 family protein [bacterium]|nr:UPF0182 family protein [bacterium]
MVLKTQIKVVGIFIILAIFIFLSQMAIIYTDYAWFDAIGFSQIFLISLKSKIFLFLAAAAAFFVFAGLNLFLASKLTKEKSFISAKFRLTILIVLSLIIGLGISSQWFTVQQYLNQVPFDVVDPIFAKDVSFYIFTLPFYTAVWSFAVSCVALTLILVILFYLQTAISSIKSTFKQPQDPMQPKPTFEPGKLFSVLKRKATTHISILISLFFVLLAVKHYLARFSIMYSEKGIVVGAGYTDVVIYLPIVKILMVLALVIAVLFLVLIPFFSKRPGTKKLHIMAYIVAIYVLVAVLGTTAIPGLVQSFKVSPNEMNLEKEYIENNIRFTKLAYNLDDVEEKDFDVESSITPDLLDEYSETIDNVRILDWRPLTQTYKQTQEIRLYYDLSGIDIDRYNIDGKYTEVMLAPRELDQNQITQNAKTWMNLHMVYTHGYGIVMSPVNSVTKEGLPEFLIKDIPPTYTVDEEAIKISNPQVYYGEQHVEFVLTNTNTEEFDYPKGSTNEYTKYAGKGGVKLDSFIKKVMMAFRFKDIKILLSSDLTPESKIMFKRNIKERISTITPFVALDNDPYLVINDGELFWIQDAYTFTGNYPYSDKRGQINYIRNSVKIVVGAFDGDVTYYMMDDSDPLINTYAKIFPDQFRSYDDMPDGLKEHIRYPEDLFKIQADIFNTYHMNDATVFYNKEDAWQVPYEIYGVGQQEPVDPYYVIMKLPGETEEEFVLMSAFTPIKKDNMISWMAARSDGENYGKLILYKFPKDKLVYGPLQVEAKFDQDSEISQQLTLWSQQGSQVTRGNLLVIPIKNSILYIEPLYIQAEQGQLPELKRVLVSDGERVVMEENLGIALKALFGSSKPKKDDTDEDKSVDELIDDANLYYEQVLDSMNQQDWAAIGANFDKLGEILEELKN